MDIWQQREEGDLLKNRNVTGTFFILLRKVCLTPNPPAGTFILEEGVGVGGGFEKSKYHKGINFEWSPILCVRNLMISV